MFELLEVVNGHLRDKRAKKERDGCFRASVEKKKREEGMEE